LHAQYAQIIDLKEFDFQRTISADFSLNKKDNQLSTTEVGYAEN